MNYMNYVDNSNLNFTMAMGSSGELPFLDCSTSRDNNSFTTFVYKKSSFSGLGITFLSHCTFDFKLYSTKTLVNGPNHILSIVHSSHLEMTILKNFFYYNGFPTHLIDKVFHKFLSSKYNAASQLVYYYSAFLVLVINSKS